MQQHTFKKQQDISLKAENLSDVKREVGLNICVKARQVTEPVFLTFRKDPEQNLSYLTLFVQHNG